jgi:hypothetical protein
MSMVLSGVYLTVEVVSLFQGLDVHVVYCYSFKSDLESFSLWNYVSHVFQIKYKLKQYKCGMMDKIKRLNYNKCDVQLSKLYRIIDSNVFIVFLA